MAQPNLESFKRRGLALALRASASVPTVPTASADGVLLFNGSSGTEFDKIERPVDRPFLTGQPFAVGAKRAFIEGEFELFPPTKPGAAADSDAVCAPLLLPAGMTAVKDAVAKTTRYKRIAQEMVTVLTDSRVPVPASAAPGGGNTPAAPAAPVAPGRGYVDPSYEVLLQVRDGIQSLARQGEHNALMAL